jgi:hypothetical protein
MSFTDPVGDNLLYNHVTIMRMGLDEGNWMRCRVVEIEDGNLVCDLDWTRTYDLEKAYPKDPHVQLLNCANDEDLLRFTRAWGPLYLRTTGGPDDEWQTGRARRPLAEYRAALRRFRGVKGILEAAKGNGDEREALAEFLAADEEEFQLSALYKPGEPPNHQFSLKLWLRIDGSIFDWIRTAPMAQIRQALKYCVEAEVKMPWTGGVRVVPHKGRTKLIPSYRLSTLQDALAWMIWFDEWNTNPPNSLPCLSYRLSPAQPSQDEILQLSLRPPDRDAQLPATKVRIEKTDR